MDHIAINVSPYTPESHPTTEMLFYGATHNHINYIEDCINGGVMLNMVDRTGKTALIHCVFQGHKSNILRLINAGADVNIGPKTALMFAAQYQLKSIVEILINSGANPFIRNPRDNHKTALDYAHEHARGASGREIINMISRLYPQP